VDFSFFEIHGVVICLIRGIRSDLILESMILQRLQVQGH